MSRIAKNPIPVPKGVDVTISGALVTVKGKLGQLSHECPTVIRVEQVDSTLKIIDKEFEALKERLGDKVGAKAGAPALAGLTRALVNNMVVGVSEGFECKLELKGVGYRANVAGSTLNLSVGFSHPVAMQMPDGITAVCPSQTQIVLSGTDKQKVFQIGANIRSVRPPEPYKGKGIRYVGEHVVMKEVKKK